MASDKLGRGFTIYLEGHEGHQGNVLAHSFVSKLNRLIVVLGKLERAYLDTAKRQTDFEITDTDKTNPTTISLKPVPRIYAYDPTPAFQWGIRQIDTVGKGGDPDDRVRSDIANDLVKLATKESEDGYRAFWINGYAEAVRFDDEFLSNAQRIALERMRKESPTHWHVGASIGRVIGELKKVDDLNDEQQFVIVPRTIPEGITCTFPDSMREEMGQYLFKIVQVRGTLHYGKSSPFPYRVDAEEQGISLYPTKRPRRNLLEMRGTFSGQSRQKANWDELLND